MLPSNIKIISNYQLYPTPGPVPSQLCFVSRRMNEENVPLPAHHQETVPGPHQEEREEEDLTHHQTGQEEVEEEMCDSCPPALGPASGLCDRAV